MYFLTIALLGSWQKCLCAIAALAIHETAHVLTSLLFHERIALISLSPFGGAIEFDSNQCAKKGMQGVLIALAGPAANYTAILFITAPQITRLLGFQWTHELLITNLSMLILNLMPALPLDGGRAAFCIGYCFLDITLLSRILALSGACVGIALISLGLFAALTEGIINLSAFIVGGWIIAAASRCRVTLLYESRLAVLQERSAACCKAHRRIALYQASADTDALSVLPDLRNDQYALYYLEDAKQGSCLISESMLLHALIMDPSIKMSDVAAVDSENHAVSLWNTGEITDKS